MSYEIYEKILIDREDVCSKCGCLGGGANRRFCAVFSNKLDCITYLFSLD